MSESICSRTSDLLAADAIYQMIEADPSLSWDGAARVLAKSAVQQIMYADSATGAAEAAYRLADEMAGRIA